MTRHTHPLSWRLVVTAQVALGLGLTIGGSLLVGSLLAVYSHTPPIDASGVVAVPVGFQGMTTRVGHLAPERSERVEALIERVRGVPGVEAIALTGYDLLEHAYQASMFDTPDTALRSRAMVTHAVTADFYRVLRPQLVSGRFPTDLELSRHDPVIVVSEAVGSTYWPEAPAVGQTLTDRGRGNETPMTFTVVGVVRDVPWAAWDETALPTIYGPYALLARQTNSALLIRPSAGLEGVVSNAVRVMTDADPLLRAGRPATLDALYVDSVRPRRFRAWAFGSFAFASLVIVGIGIFGQLAMSTARRTREVGIRMTCGATGAGVVRLIQREQLLPVLAGLMAGAIGSAWAVQFVGSYLYEVTSFDARIWSIAIGLILLSAAAGATVPAVRASRVQPTEALRVD